MNQFLGVLRHEFSMSIRRPGLWIAYTIVCGFFSISLFVPGSSDQTDIYYAGNSPWVAAGETVYLFNMLMPLIGGILAADRLQRDLRLGLRELQNSTPLGSTTYILGKYFGVLLSTLLPMLAWLLLSGVYTVATGMTTSAILVGILVAFLAIVVPSFAFVVAFSLACPLVMPLRVYQVLFTGYWFWGNFLNHEVFPTVSGTLLNASGIYASQGFFRGSLSLTSDVLHTPMEAWLNILVLGLCAAFALLVLDRYLAWQTKRA
jgi:ABC-2 type transport system permease protein